MIDLTKRYRFSASHRLNSPLLSDEENDATYGKCNNPFGHGHNYTLQVTVTGPVDPETGLAVDLPTLDQLVKRVVIDRYDHRNMNVDLPEYRDLVPTTEVVARVIAGQLCEHWREAFPGPYPQLRRVRIHETKNNIFEVTLNETT